MKQRVEHALRRLAAQELPASASAERPRPRPWDQPEDPSAALRGTVSAASNQPTAGVRRRRMLVAAGLTVAAVAGSVVGLNWFFASTGAPIATAAALRFRPLSPPVGSADVLTALADRAARQPAPGGNGGFLYLARDDAEFNTAQDTSARSLGSGLVKYRQETWLAPDGSGRFLRVEQENPHAGAKNPLTMDGPLPGRFGTAEVRQPTPEALRAWMLSQGSDRGTAGWFEKATAWNRLADPQAVAAYLRILAAQPGITVEGSTTDRAGRPAIAVSTVAADPGGWFPEQRRYLLLDPDTGLLLGAESMALTADAEAIGDLVTAPAVIGYTIWRRTAHVPTTAARP
ncbi:hypothetical protein ACWEHA_21265 [Amycolatopsis nivea]